MDKKTLEKYKSWKREAKLINKQISKLKERRDALPVIKGKVQSSDNEFPYTQRRVSVEMYEPKEADKIKWDIIKKQMQRNKIELKMMEIEEFIDSIPPGETKEIFEMYFLQGMKQSEVADTIGYSRGRISQKISEYLKD